MLSEFIVLNLSLFSVIFIFLFAAFIDDGEDIVMSEQREDQGPWASDQGPWASENENEEIGPFKRVKLKRNYRVYDVS